MRIKDPIVAEIAKGVWCINEFGLDSLFLIEGEKRALLIDTGTGVFDLPALIKTLTDKPYDVALTHGHVDHAGGIGWFDDIYLHPADFDAALHISVDSRKGFAERTSIGTGVWELTTDDVIAFDHSPATHAIHEGHVFDLGGRHVRVYETPGHTPGGLSFLIEEERVIITGDACNPNTLMFFTHRPDGSRVPHASIEGLLATARKIDSLQPKYDRNYNGHIGFGPLISFMPMTPRITKDIIALCEGILAGTVQYEIADNGFGGKAAIANCPSGRVQFNPDCLREE